MATGHSVVHVHARNRVEPGLPFAVLESKLTPPFVRDGTVPRAALRERLKNAATPLVAIVAPPGYGKTTLLSQWAEQTHRPVAWLSLDEHDNDPAVLLTYLAVALHRAEPIDQEIFRTLTSRSVLVSQATLPRLAGALTTGARPLTLILDNLEVLHDPRCTDALAELAGHLRRGSQLALASRSALPLRMELLRAQGCVLEIGIAELAMDQREGRALLRAAGVRLSCAEAAKLIRRTEGWPVGLYLAALALQAPAASHASTGTAFGGNDRLVADYLWSELLSRLPPATVTFLTRTAVLDRICGPLCDAVLQTTGSAELLDSLERANLLVVGLDRHREWYRYHHLFRDLLRAEERRREPHLVDELLRRAAQWHERNGLPQVAVNYAMQGGDADRAARLVAQLAFPVYYSGRLSTLQRWLDWFDRNGLTDRYPAVAVLGACVYALVGQPAAAERLADAAERGSARLRDASPVAGIPVSGWLAFLKAVLCRTGVEQMRADAEAAVALVPLGSVLRPSVLLLLGISHLLAGDTASADRVLMDALEVAEDAGAPDTAALILAERAIVAMGQEQWAEARALVERGCEITASSQVADYATTALLHAAAARVAVRNGAPRQARQELARAWRLRSQLVHSVAFLAVQTRLELVRAHLALLEPASARTLLSEVDDLLGRRPQLGSLPQQATQLRAQLDRIGADAHGAASLTAAELRVLPLLVSYRSFHEIGEQLHVSRYTVKSHAMSIYRKFGVSSRGEAIRRAQDLGLLNMRPARL
jgi:LuxR family maltose regulon positive regulatory protein